MGAATTPGFTKLLLDSLNVLRLHSNAMANSAAWRMRVQDTRLSNRQIRPVRLLSNGVDIPHSHKGLYLMPNHRHIDRKKSNYVLKLIKGIIPLRL